MAHQDQDDPYARDSFTFRRMTRGQVWTLTVFVAIVVVAVIVYAYGGF